MSKIAFITGINGQDGSYLTELLLEKGYIIHGIIRRSSVFNTQRIDHLMNNEDIYNKKLFIHYGDVTDPVNINQLISSIQPDEVYNLAAQSHVKVSFELPCYTAQTDAIGTLNVLEAIRNHCPKARLYQASTSELFGGVGYNMPPDGYTEESQFHPRSPYGVAKLYGYWIIKNYREAYKMFACNGILFNHSSKHRGETFFTRKVTSWCGKNFISLQKNDNVIPLSVGNISSKRDEMHSYDAVVSMNLIINQKTPDDYVVGSGETHSGKEWIEQCFKWMNLPIEWKGEGVNEIGISRGKTVVNIDRKYFRPSEVPVLLSNPIKIKSIGWKPKYSYEMIVNDMMTADVQRY